MQSRTIWKFNNASIYLYMKYAKVEQFGNLIMQAYIYIRIIKTKIFGNF